MKPRVSQLAQSGATPGQGLVWNGTIWAPATIVDAAAIPKSLVDAKGDLLVATANDTPARLAVGSDGLALLADSTQTTGLRWGTVATDPTTTKGDLLARSSSALNRLGVGSNGDVLTADSTQTLGVKWAAPGGGYSDPLTTKGDLVTRTSSATTRRAVGSNGQVLTADSAEADGVKWATPSSGGATQVINDDLSSTSGLLTALNGSWAINAGVLRQSNTAASTTHISHATLVTPASTRIAEVSCSYVSGSGTRRMGLIVSSTNAGSGNLLVYIQTSNGTSFTAHVENDGVTLYFSSGTLSYTGSGYVRVGAVLTGTMCDLYVDGTWLGVVNTAFNPGKYVGMYTYGQSADFRNLKAWTPTVSPM